MVCSKVSSFLVAFRRLTPVVMAMVSFAAAQAWAGPTFIVQSFDAPAGDQSDVGVSAAGGISNSGVIIGTYYTSDSTAHGYILDHGTYTYFDAPGAGMGNFNGTTGVSINSAGQAIVESYDNSGHMTPYLYSGGLFSAINDPLAAPNSTYTSSINEKGIVTGFYHEANTFNTTSYQYDTSTKTFTTISDVPGSAESFAVATSSKGDILTFYFDGVNRLDHIAVVHDGVYTTLDDILGATSVTPVGINASGVISGNFTDADFNSHAFEYINGTYYDITYPGAAVTGLGGINDAGQAAGYWYEASFESHSLIVTPVPEPSSLVLCGLASVISLSVRRYKCR